MSVPAGFGGVGSEQLISRPRPEAPEAVTGGGSGPSRGALLPGWDQSIGSGYSRGDSEQSGGVFEEEDSLGMLSEATIAMHWKSGSGGALTGRRNGRRRNSLAPKIVIGVFLAVMLGGLVFVLYLAMTFDPNTWAAGTTAAVKTPKQKTDVAREKAVEAAGGDGVESEAAGGGEQSAQSARQDGKAGDGEDSGGVAGGAEEGAGPSEHFEGFVLGAKETTVIAIDASGLSKGWLWGMKSLVAECIEQAPAGAAAQVVFWTDYGAKSYPDKPAVLNGQKKEELQAFMKRVGAISVADPMPTVKLSLKSKPGRLILVTGQALSEEQVKAIQDQLGEHSKTRLDFVLVDLDMPDLKKWVEGLGGVYRSITAAAVTGKNGVVDRGEVPGIESATDEGPSRGR